jgi:hypothetical protein
MEKIFEEKMMDEIPYRLQLVVENNGEHVHKYWFLLQPTFSRKNCLVKLFSYTINKYHYSRNKDDIRDFYENLRLHSCRWISRLVLGGELKLSEMGDHD